MKVFCPYCTREIPAGGGHCPSCGSVYDLDTLGVLKMLAEEEGKEYPEERRTQVRTTKVEKLELSASPSPPDPHTQSPENISLGGLFIRTDTPLKKGERFHLRLFLTEEASDLEILCEVMWSQTGKDLAASGETGPAGMGVRFLNPTQEDIKRIIGILSRSLDNQTTFL